MEAIAQDACQCTGIPWQLAQPSHIICRISMFFIRDWRGVLRNFTHSVERFHLHVGKGSKRRGLDKTEEGGRSFLNAASSPQTVLLFVSDTGFVRTCREKA